MRKDLPIINVTSYSLYDKMKSWLLKKTYQYNNTAEACRNYVEKWHDPLKIARILKSDYLRILN